MYSLEYQTVTVGRDESDHIVVDGPNISRRHFAIEQSQGQFVIRDQGSTNGTFVNGQQVTYATLKEGDTITIGELQFTFTAI